MRNIPCPGLPAGCRHPIHGPAGTDRAVHSRLAHPRRADGRHATAWQLERADRGCVRAIEMRRTAR